MSQALYNYSTNICPSLKFTNRHVARGQLVKQKFMLSSNFRCDQIFKMRYVFWSHFVVLLKSDLDVQKTHLYGAYP